MSINEDTLRILGVVFLASASLVLLLRILFMIVKKHRWLALDMILIIVFAITALIGISIKKTMYIDCMIIGTIIYFVSNIILKRLNIGINDGKKSS